MEKRSKLTEEQLNQIPKDVLVSMYLQLSDTMMQVAEQNNQLLRQVTSLEEKINILTQRYFGRHRRLMACSLPLTSMRSMH